MRPLRGLSRLAAGAAALALAACTAVPETGAPGTVEPAPAPPTPVTEIIVVVPDDARDLAELVGYYSRVAGMSPDEQRREYAGASQAFNRERSALNRVRLALLASMPGTQFHDDARALGLLEPFAAGPGDAGKVGQLGAMLHAQVSERARARGRADQLKEQLDALRAVERTIIERGQGPPAKRQ